MRDQQDNINVCCTPGKVVRGYLSCCSAVTFKYVALHILEKHFNNKCKLKRKSETFHSGLTVSSISFSHVLAQTEAAILCDISRILSLFSQSDSRPV